MARAMVQGIQGNNSAFPRRLGARAAPPRTAHPYPPPDHAATVSACVKHWIFNSQETNRSGVSSNVAERVGRELYGPPYAAAVDAGVGTVMCS